MWEHSFNSNSNLINFKDELDKDIQTKGSWDLDYKEICEKFSVVSCPFYNVTESTFKIQNSIIDLPSWRCMLLCIAISTPAITDLIVHNCQLSPQHIVDLIAVLTKSEGGFKTLRLEYLDFENKENRAEFFQALDPLFTSEIKVEFLSLRGNSISDDVIIRNASSLQSNFR
jgi:hypothetical protein